MSLYEKYFSSQNKTHVYSVMSQIILRETGKDISKDSYYQEMYKFNYPRIFEDSQKCELVEINKELLDRVGSQIITHILGNRDYITVSGHLSPIAEGSEIESVSSGSSLSSLSSVSGTENPSKVSLNVYSSDRIKGSRNRYDYILELQDKHLSLKCLTIPKEPNALFSNPTIIIGLQNIPQDELKVVCTLSETRDMGDRKYLTYLPETEIRFPVKHSLRVRLYDYRGAEVLKSVNDVVGLLKHKHVVYCSKPYTCLAILRDATEYFDEGDIVGLYKDEVCHYTVGIKEIQGSYILSEPIKIKEPISTLMNISLQNHLVFSEFPPPATDDPKVS